MMNKPKTSDTRRSEFFAKWRIPTALLSELEPLKQDNPVLDLFYPGNVIPFSGKYRSWSPLLNYELLPIGNCPNADFVAVDWKHNPGSVVYVSHDAFDTTGETRHDISKISIRVASSVSMFLAGLRNMTMPLDYYEAKGRDSNHTPEPIGAKRASGSA